MMERAELIELVDDDVSSLGGWQPGFVGPAMPHITIKRLSDLRQVVSEIATFEVTDPRVDRSHSKIWSFGEGRVLLVAGYSLPASADPSDAAVVPGQAASQSALEDESKRADLVRLALRFATEGFSWGLGTRAIISRDTFRAFQVLLKNLPPGARLPRIAPETDGSLLLHWETAAHGVLAVLEGWTLHLVEAPATPHAKYHAPTALDETSSPPLTLIKAISN